MVDLLDEQARNVALLVNEIGISDATRAARIPSDGTYLVSVVYDGPWTLTLTHPGEAEFAGAVTLPQKFTGSGTQVTAYFYARTGALMVSGRQNGEDNFIADVLDTTGRNVGLAVNVIGTEPSQRVVRIPRDGIYLIAVNTDGDWSLDVGP